MELHHLHPELLTHRVRVLVVGCGGNGSAIAAGLPYLHQALLAYGHSEGLHVTLLDPDAVSPTNCVRQPFSQSEIGLYKSVVLANRLNLFWGLDWEGIPERLDPKRRLDGVDIVIGCTAGMLNGIFGEGEERHIAHWRSVKFTDHWEEEEEDGTRILHDRERFSHELTLVFSARCCPILPGKPRLT